MSDLTDVKFFLASLIRPIVKEAVREEFTALNAPTVPPADAAPVMTSAEVKALTGWPDGTFYKKVAEMPDDVVIRRSKRLLFVRAKFMQWLQTPVAA